MIRWIVLAVALWGGVLALGAFLADERPWRFGRAAIVFGCTVAFLAFWGAMLAARQARLARRDAEQGPPEAPP